MPVGVPGVVADHAEGAVRTDAETLGERALGLLDDHPAAQGGLELLIGKLLNATIDREADGFAMTCRYERLKLVDDAAQPVAYDYSRPLDLATPPPGEEIVQAAFVEAFCHLQRYERRGTFGAWVKEFARNLLKRELARLARAPRTGVVAVSALVAEAALSDPATTTTRWTPPASSDVSVPCRHASRRSRDAGFLVQAVK